LELPIPITTADMVRELERERSYRERVYPRLVEAGKLPQHRADRQIAVLDAAIQCLRDWRA
jgi:hypothetical protein